MQPVLPELTTRTLARNPIDPIPVRHAPLEREVTDAVPMLRSLKDEMAVVEDPSPNHPIQRLHTRSVHLESHLEAPLGASVLRAVDEAATDMPDVP